MIDIQALLLSIMMGLLGGMGAVAAQKARVEKQKVSYVKYWTPKRYKILFISISIMIGAIVYFGFKIRL